MYKIFQASVKNVNELSIERKHLKRLFNLCIERNEKAYFKVLTNSYALLYSSFAEVCFVKIINTPYGFNDDEINQINQEIIHGRARERNLEDKWKKCLELAFKKIENLANDGEIQNKKLRLKRLITEFILEPSQIRNKIAHGQWKQALNSKNTDINPLTTSKIKNLDFVKIDILYLIYEKIAQTVEDLIESPEKAHFNDFYYHMTELEVLLENTKNWSLESKTQNLKEKLERIARIKDSKNKPL